MTKSARRLVLVVLLALLIVAVLALVACDFTDGNDGWGTVFNYQTAYAEAQELGYTGTLQEFIASITGKDGTDGKDGVGIKSVVVNSESHLIVTLSNDIVVDCGSIKGEKGDKGDQGEQGVQGENGTDGVTPQLKVGEDNFWYVSYDNGVTWTCLNVKATGADGEQGQQGIQGEKGDKGDQGIQGEKGEDGTDGITPQLRVGEDNFWYVSYDNGTTWTCLNVKATGADGAQGEQGVQGEKGETGATGEKGDKGDQGEQGIHGEDGQDGTDGVTPQLKVGEDNFWYVSYDNGTTWTCLDVKATGTDGVTPQLKVNESSAWYVSYDNGTTWTYLGVNANGAVAGEKGDKGDKGDTGVSIVNTAFDSNGNTVISYSDGTTQTIEHNWKKTYTLVEASCTTEGKELYSCSDCGLVRFVTVPTLAHNFIFGVCDLCGKDNIPVATGLEYVLSSDQTFYIVNGIGTETQTSFKVPAEHDGLPVKSVSNLLCNAEVIALSEGIERLETGAICGWNELKKVWLPTSLVRIDEYNFETHTNLQLNEYEGCLYIGSIDNPFFALVGANGTITSLKVHKDAVIVTGHYLAQTSSTITSITVTEGSKRLVSIDNCLIDTLTKTLVLGCENSMIPTDGSVTVIGDYSFYCSSVSQVVVPDCVTTIGDEIFCGCYNLSKLVIPSSVKQVGHFVLDGCQAVVVFCEAASQPIGWGEDWNMVQAPVVWNCNNNNVGEDGNKYVRVDGVNYQITNDAAVILPLPSKIQNVHVLAYITVDDSVYMIKTIEAPSNVFSMCISLQAITFERPNCCSTDILENGKSVTIQLDLSDPQQKAKYLLSYNTLYCHGLVYHEAKESTSSEVGWEAYYTCSNEECSFCTKAEV